MPPMELYQVWDEDDDSAWVQAESFEAAAKLVPAAAVVTNVLREEAERVMVAEGEEDTINLWALFERERGSGPKVLAWKRMLGLPARRPSS